MPYNIHVSICLGEILIEFNNGDVWIAWICPAVEGTTHEAGRQAAQRPGRHHDCDNIGALGWEEEIELVLIEQNKGAERCVRERIA